MRRSSARRPRCAPRSSVILGRPAPITSSDGSSSGTWGSRRRPARSRSSAPRSCRGSATPGRPSATRWRRVHDRSRPGPPVIEAPLDRYRDVVRPEWIDHNRHMNMGYYLVVFDYATDEFFRWIGLDETHRHERQVTTFCLETHVTYHREVRAGDPLRFTTLLLAHDPKRIHYVHQMYHAAEGFLAATNELMSLHVSESTRRSAPMASEILERLGRIQAAHDALPKIGRAHV